MHKNWVMSQDSFEGLLEWLDADRDQAGIKYEQIRTGLIKFFNCRTHCEAEDLADETINRVISRLDEVQSHVTGERTRYFFGVARKVQMEYLRRKIPQAAPESLVDSRRVDVEYRCLEECIARLSAENRELVLRYYAADGREKIEERKLLAEKLGIAPNALRIRAYRIRAALQKCLERCVEDSLQ
jgi:DNA-directed RNA polymerase specialized sigma24 family protein